MDLLGASDEKLVFLAVGGESSAFELIVRRHADVLWQFARCLLGSDQDAEDAVQETFVRAYRGLSSFRGRAALRTWLVSVCRRACLDLIAQRRNVLPLDRAARLQHIDEHAEDRHLIKETLEAMPADERLAFVLVDLLGLSREEAARTEGVPPSTLKSRLYRARDRLAAALAIRDEGSLSNGL